jgi:hypothetical protein
MPTCSRSLARRWTAPGGYIPRIRHANMKEPRLDAAVGVSRVAFAFGSVRRAVLLVAGDKTGKGSTER